MPLKCVKKITQFFVLLAGFAILIQSPLAQVTIESRTDAKANRERGLEMLEEIKDALKSRYYDKKFRGIDLDEKFTIAAERIKKLDANWQIFRVIAQVVLELNDSHTRFYPPSRANRVEYGFSLQMIGDYCLVVDVKKGSDAEAKGLKVGDFVTQIAKYNPTRESLWKINYLLYWLDPLEELSLFVLNPDKTEREIKIKSSFKSIKEREQEAKERRKQKAESPYRCQEINSETIACKLKTFSTEKRLIDKMMKEEVGEHKKLILDLRGNGGGYVRIEEYLTGYFFQDDTKIATFIMRNDKKERIAKSQKKDAYKGELIVLIDSTSASASEVFSRVIQLEKRGKIVGDVSRGAVMTSILLRMATTRGTRSMNTASIYALSLTIGDLIMSDGNRLENVGVIPDYPVGPGPNALARKADPVLAYSAELFGAKLSADEAGKFYFITEKPEDEDDTNDDDDGAEN